MKKLLLIIAIILMISGCTPEQQNVNQNASRQISTAPVTPTISLVPGQANSEIETYLVDVEEQTHRKITDEQKKLLLDYIAKNKIEKLSSAETKKHRHKFDGVRKKLIAEWEQHTGQKWPKYSQNVLSKNGKVDRKVGTNYDAHHIVELSYGGPNEWWNLHPAASPNEHQQGIHRKDGPANKLFDDED